MPERGDWRVGCTRSSGGTCYGFQNVLSSTHGTCAHPVPSEEGRSDPLSWRLYSEDHSSSNKREEVKEGKMLILHVSSVSLKMFPISCIPQTSQDLAKVSALLFLGLLKLPAMDRFGAQSVPRQSPSILRPASLWTGWCQHPHQSGCFFVVLETDVLALPETCRSAHHVPENSPAC